MIPEPAPKRMRHTAPAVAPPPPGPSFSSYAQPTSSHITRVLIKNPDDDGRDGMFSVEDLGRFVLLKSYCIQSLEKYLHGNWKSRLLLALQSALPNEVDWAFNKLVKLSFSQNFYIEIVPGLLDAILEHAAPLFDSLILNTSANDFQTTQTNSANRRQAVPTLSEIGVFNTPESATLLERTMQVLHVLRNLSFVPDNAVEFCRNYTLLTVIAKGVALPACTHFIEIKQHTLDIFENMAPHVTIRGEKDFYLACLRQIIFENDRGMIIASIRTLTRLCMSEPNQEVLGRVDDAFVGRLLQLLLVPDEDLVGAVLDWLYQYSGLGPEVGARIAECAKFNVLKLLTKFLHWRGFNPEGYGRGLTAAAAPTYTPALRATVAAAIGDYGVANTPTAVTAPMVGFVPSTPTTKAKTPIMTPEATEAVNAQNWLLATFEMDASATMSHAAFLREYEVAAREAKVKSLGSKELIEVLNVLFPGARLESGPGGLVIRGLSRRLRGSEPTGPSGETSEGPVEVYGVVKGGTDGSATNDGGDGNLSATSAPFPGSPVVGTSGTIACWWGRNPVQPQSDGCIRSFGGESDLLTHIQSEHVPLGRDRYGCEWKGCTAFKGDKATPHRARILAHLATHAPLGTAHETKQPQKVAVDETSGITKQTADAPIAGVQSYLHNPYATMTPTGPMPPSYPMYAPNPYIIPPPEEDLKGIPLTTLLVLRNLARHPGNRSLFVPFEGILAHMMMTNQKFSKGLAGVLAELRS
ncbi:Chromatin structure-remodeling complex protein rsc9 [Borealophlyctis nickersoniae]|nr:Chromatin structure-remodeling complex protein rsc9 [Borealophlyctis nickersoniae]